MACNDLETPGAALAVLVDQGVGYFGDFSKPSSYNDTRSSAEQAGSWFANAVSLGILGSDGPDPENQVHQVMASIIYARALTQLLSQCSANVKAKQQITVDCNGNGDLVFTEMAGCKACALLQDVALLRRIQLENEAIQRGGRPSEDFFAQSYTQKESDVRADMTRLCASVCNNCYAANLRQAAQVTFAQTCFNETTVQTDIEAAVQGQVQSVIANVKDVAGKAVDFLADDEQCISRSFTSSMMQSVNTYGFNKLVNKCVIAQNMVIVGESIYLDRADQTINVDSVATIISEEGVFNDLFSSQALSDATSLIEKSSEFNDFLKNLGGRWRVQAVIVHSAVQTGAAIFLIVAMVVVMIGLIIWAYSRGSFSGLIKLPR